MTTATPIERVCPDLAGPLASAASLVATAAHISVTVAGAVIDVQVPAYAGDEPTRAAAVGAYTHALGSPVQRRVGETSPHTWIEVHGTVAGHPVHVWTIADPTDQRER